MNQTERQIRPAAFFDCTYSFVYIFTDESTNVKRDVCKISTFPCSMQQYATTQILQHLLMYANIFDCDYVSVHLAGICI